MTLKPVQTSVCETDTINQIPQDEFSCCLTSQYFFFQRHFIRSSVSRQALSHPMTQAFMYESALVIDRSSLSEGIMSQECCRKDLYPKNVYPSHCSARHFPHFTNICLAEGIPQIRKPGSEATRKREKHDAWWKVEMQACLCFRFTPVLNVCSGSFWLA